MFIFRFVWFFATFILYVASAGLPPASPGSHLASPGWAQRSTPSVRRKPSNVSTVSMSEGSAIFVTYNGH